MPFTRIVHPTDFSAVAVNALQWAAHIARKSAGATLQLLHVYDRPYRTVAANGAWAALVDDTADSQIRTQLQEQIEAMASLSMLEGLHLTRKFVADSAVHRLYEHLEPDTDLIVMGTRGYQGPLHGGIVGTNTARVIRHSPVPVLAVPEHAQFERIRHIAFATDFRTPLHTHFPFLREFAQMMGAELSVVVINTRDTFATSRFVNEAYRQLQQEFPYERMQLHIHVDEDVETGIQHYLEDSGANLLAMFTHGRTGLNRLFSGSVVEDLTDSLQVPLLAFRNPQA